MAVPNQSETLDQLASALASAQAVIAAAALDRENPHFHSKYASLASIWQACRGPLSERGLSVTQTPRIVEHGQMVLVTTLLHASGQWISGEIPVACDYTKPQAVGSWFSYARRYALAAIAGVATEDDDAEIAPQPQRQPAPATAGKPPARAPAPQRRPQRPETWSYWIGPFLSQFNAAWMREMVREGIEPDVRAQWKELGNEPREVNALISRLIELGRIDEEKVAKDDKPGVRDPKKARAEVMTLFERSPGVVKRFVASHLGKKRAEARAQLGMPDLDDDEPVGVDPENGQTGEV